MTVTQQNIYFDVLDDIVNKYNNTIHRTIKMKPIEVTDEHPNKKIQNLKLMIMLEFENIKTFLLKDILQIGQKKFLLLIKLTIQFLELMLLVI